MAEELDPMTHLPEEGDPIKTKSSDDFLKQLGKNLVKPTLGTTITTKRDGINLGGSFEIENSNVGGIFDYSKKADVKSYLGTEFAAQNMEELNKAIAENQTWTSELGRTAANLIPNIAAGILENVGYMAELPGAILGYDQDFNNGLVEWSKKNRNPFGEIYRKNPNAVIDTSDSAWWFEQGGGLFESIGEFAAFGWGVGGGLGKVSSAIARGVNAGSKVTRGLKGLGQVGTSASLAYTEGAMSGATVFEEVYGKEYSKLAELGVDPLEADRLARVKASESAVTTVKLNTAINTMLNMSSVIPFSKMSTMRKAEKYGINRRAGETNDSLLARLNEAKAKGIAPTTLKSVQRYTGEAIQESAEELTNVVAERVGLDTEGEKSFTEHLEEAFKSEEGFLSMALGAIGGVVQTGVTRRLPTQKTPQLKDGKPVTDKDGKIVYDRISRRKLEKQTDINAHADFITSITDDLNNFQKLTTDLRSAVQKGDKNKIKQIKRDIFNISASNAIRKGAGEELKESYRQIANLSADDAVEAGLAENPNDTEYKQLAQEAIEDITEADKQWKAFANKYNYGDEEAVGLGKHVFNTWLAKQGHQKTSKQLRRENELLKNKIEGEDAEGVVDAFVAVQTLEKELELQEAELQEVKKLKKEIGKKGERRKNRQKLKSKYGSINVNDISAIIEKDSEKIALQLLEAQEKLKQIKLDYIEAYENEYNTKKEEHDAKYTKLNKAQQQQDDAQISKGKRKKVEPVPYPIPKKSDEDLMEELFNTTQRNANTLGDISTNESYAKHFDKQASILEGSLTEITSSKGRTAFVKAARKDLNEKIEEQKKREEKAKSKEGKAKTAARKAKAKAKPKGDHSGEAPTKSDIKEAEKNTEKSTRESDEVWKAAFNALNVPKAGEENSPMFTVSEENFPSKLEGEFARYDIIKKLLLALEAEEEIDITDFTQIAKRGNEVLGAKAFASIFGSLRSIYSDVANRPEVAGPEFEYSQIFRTTEEQEEIDSDSISLPVNNSTKEMEIKDYEKLIGEVEDAIINNTGDDSVEIKDNKGNIIGLGDLIVPAGTAFAYLAQEYGEEKFKSGRIKFSRKTTSSNELLDSMQEPLLLSPNYYQPGEKVTIREAKEFQTVEDGEEVTYDSLAAKGEDFIPIGIYNSEGALIAYLHVPSWITPKNVANHDGNVEEQIETLKAIRKEVLDKGEISSEIDFKSFGKLVYNSVHELKKDTKSKDIFIPKMRNVSEAFPDPKLTIAIGKSGTAHLAPGRQISLPDGGQLINKKELLDGVPYAIVPTPVKGSYIALPVRTKQIGSEYAESIAAALDIYFDFKGGNRGDNLTDSQKKLLNDLKSEYNIDLSTEAGMEEYFSLFGYNSFLDNEQLAEINKNDSGKKYFSVKGNGIMLAGELSRNITSYSNTDPESPGWLQQRDMVVNHLSDMYMSLKLENLTETEAFSLPVIINNNGELSIEDRNNKKTYKDFVTGHTETNLNALDLGNGEYAYMSQPVITIKKPKISKEKPTQQTSDELELKYSPVDMSTYGKTFSQADISEGGKKIIFNSYRQVFKIKDGILTTTINDADGKTFYPISVDLNNTPEYKKYQEAKDKLDAERKRLVAEGVKGIDDMLRGMGASMEVAKRQMLEVLKNEIGKKNSVASRPNAKFSQPTQQSSEDVTPKKTGEKIAVYVTPNSVGKIKNPEIAPFIIEVRDDGTAEVSIANSEWALSSYHNIEPLFLQYGNMEEGDNLTIIEPAIVREQSDGTWAIIEKGKVATNSKGIKLAQEDLQEEQQQSTQEATGKIELGDTGVSLDLGNMDLSEDEDSPMLVNLSSEITETAKEMSFAVGRNKDLVQTLNNVENIAKSLGTSVDKVLGAGGMGTAILLKNGKVLKLTGDPKEILTAQKLVKNPIPGMANYESVNLLNNGIASIVLEQLKMPSNQQQKWFDLRKELLIENEDFKNFKEGILKFENTTNKLAKSWFENKAYLDLSEPLPNNIKERWNKEKLTKKEKAFWDSFSEEEFNNLKNAKESLNITSAEIKGDNLGFNKQNELILFDATEDISQEDAKEWIKNNIKISTEEDSAMPYTEAQQQVTATSIKGYVLPNTSLFRQQQIIGTVNAAIMGTLQTRKEKALLSGNKKEGELNSEEVYGLLKTHFENLIAPEKNPHPILKKRLENVLSMWDDVTNISKRQLRALGILSTKEELAKKDDTDIEILGSQDEVSELDTALSEMESNYEKINYSDSLTFMIDGKKTMSSRLRQFFAFVPDTGKSYLGGEIFVPFDTVINTLNEELAGVENSEEAMLSALKTAADRAQDSEGNSWMNNLVELVEEAPTHIKNEIMVFGSKHYANFKTVLWEIKSRPVPGSYGTQYEKVPTMRVIDTNRYAISKVIESQWQENIKSRELVTLSSEGDMIIDETVAKEMVQSYERIVELVKDNDDNALVELRGWLNEMGVNISKEALQEIKLKSKYLFKRGGEFKSQFRKNGIFFHMNERLKGINDGSKKEQESSLESRNPLLRDSGVKELARVEAKYTTNHLTNSHKNGKNQTVFSYSMNKALTHRFNELMVGEVLEKLKDNPFTSFTAVQEGAGDLKISSYNSLWAKSLYKEIDPLFKKHFNVTYLDTISQEGNSNAVSSFSEMSPKELELAKITLFFNQNLAATYKEGSRRKYNRYISHFMMPTLSDKTTMPIVTALKYNVPKEFNGNKIDLNGDAARELSVIARAEIDRINYHTKNSENKDYIGNKLEGYKDGANKFLFFPFLNKEVLEYTNPDSLDLIWDGDTVKTDDAAKAEIKRLIIENVGKLIDNKVANWMQDEFIVPGKRPNNPYDFKLFDRNYKRELFEIKEGTKEEQNLKRAQYAAADYVINQIIANANMMQIIAGDPAMFYKKAKKENATILDDVKATWDNIGKRLAKEIAPGLDIPKGPKDRYTSIFLKDITGASKNFKEIEKSLTKAGLPKEAIDEYLNMDITDAQEYTTGLEHVYIMYQMGKLTDEEYKQITDKLKKGEDLDTKELGKVLQTMKPVYAKNINDSASKLERVVYIKSSSFPLLPQITKGLEIDKLRQMMEGVDEKGNLLPGVSPEEARNKISRASYNTAAKLGSIESIDWRAATAEEAYATYSVQNMQDRSGMRIQQELPFSETKSEITKGTQETALLFINILDSKGFKYKGEKLTGKKLSDKFNELHGKIFADGRKKVLEEIADANGNLDIRKLQKLLLDEAKNKGYSISDIQSLNLHNLSESRVKLSMPLWASSSANKFESLLTSIISNRVTKIKTRGFSGPVGSEAGFTLKEGEDAKKDLKDNRIVFTDSFDPKQGLLPMRPGVDEDGEKVMLPAQIIAPFKHTDNNGKVLDLKDFITEVDGKQMLDLDKLPKELLKSYNFRTPTQGPNSTAMVEIVGFLPYEMGDLILAPQDFVAQMGQDFDIDKLGAYLYNTNLVYKKSVINEEDDARILAEYNEWAKGKESPSREEYARETSGVYFTKGEDGVGFFVDTEKNKRQIERLEKYETTKEDGDVYSWQNDLLDIRFAVVSNAANEVRAQVSEPLLFGKLKVKGKPDVTDMVMNGARAKRIAAENIFMGISAEYQKQVFYAGKAGQIGIGVFSTDSKFNAIAQIADSNGKTLRSTKEDVDENGNNIIVDNPITFKVWDNKKKEYKDLPSSDLSSKSSVTDPKRYKSQIIAGFQSASVDNANEQILQKLNINNTTFNAFSAFNQLGWEEEYSVGVMAQDIMFDLVAEIENQKDSIGGNYTRDNIETAKNTVLERSMLERRFNNDREAMEAWLTEQNANPYLSKEELEAAITEGVEYVNYDRVQYLALNYFEQANELGENLRKIKYAINTDSKHLGKSLIETSHKENSVNQLEKNTAVSNALALLGEIVVENIAGFPNSELVPNTIPGYATKEGLFLANKLFKDLFPYKKEGVKLVTKEILELAGIDESKMTKYMEAQRKVFNDMKSYLWARGELKLIDATSAEERQRLMFDRSELQEITEEFTRADNSIGTRIVAKRVSVGEPSLASRVREFQKTVPGERNPLMRLLTTDIDLSGKTPSVVEYNSAAGENLDEAMLHSALIELLNSSNEETRTLGQDLINYAVLTGFTQGATNFVKYVSPAYLNAMGVNAAFREFDSQLNSVDIFGGVTSKSDFAISRFARQFFQNNPDFAPKLDKKYVKKENGKFPKEFVLDQKDELSHLLKVSSELGGTYTNVIAVSDTSSTKKYRLYESVKVADNGSSVIFRQLDTAGYKKGISEYSPELSEVKSGIEGNKASAFTKAPIKGKDPRIPAAFNSGGKTEINTSLTNSIYTEYGLFGENNRPINTFGGKGTTVIVNALNQIERLATSNGERVMAGVLAKAVEVLNPNLDIRVGDMRIPAPEYGGPTFTKAIGKGINMRPELIPGLSIIGINTSNDAHKTRTDINETIMHELTHALTVTSLDTKAGKKITELYDDIYYEATAKNGSLVGTKIGNFTLNLETLVDFENSYNDWVSLKNKTKFNKEEQAKIDKWNKYLEDGALEVLYPFVNAKEFVTAAMTNPDFQLWLNSIDHVKSEDKSVWQKLLDLISDLFADFTIGDTGEKVAKGKVLEASLASILNIIEENSAGAFSASLDTSPFIGGDTNTLNNPVEFTNHSGGALGADSMFDTIGKEFGQENHRHYYYGSKTPKGNVLLTESQVKEGIVEMNKAAKILGKNPSKQSTINLLARNWFQVKNADAVFAIAPLEDTKTPIVEGGTGWAVAMAWENNKPINVFDTKTNTWFLLNKKLSNRPIELLEAPVLTKNFAGIGSRNITEAGKQAIRDVYEKTFSTQPTIKETFKVGDKVIVNKKKSTYYNQEGTYTGLASDGIKHRVLLSDKKTMQYLPENLTKKIEEAPKKIIKGKEIPEDILNPGTREITLPNGTKIFLNKGQDKAVNEVEDFLNDPNKDVFTLVGRGGTGKTTIINEALEGKAFIAAAPTNKAKDVIAKAIGDETLQKTFTIDQILASSAQWVKGKKVFIPDTKKIQIGKAPITRANIIVIDEASMITQQTLDWILKYKRPGAKIIFMGDNVQLAPVDTESKVATILSPVFKIPGAKLTERMRQGEDHPIVALTDLYAKNVELFQNKKKGVPNPLPLDARKTNIDKVADSGLVFANNFNDVISSVISDIKKDEANGNFDNTKVIAYTNKAVTNANKKIREILNPDAKLKYDKGDVIIMKEAYLIDNTVVINNSETVKVVESVAMSKQDTRLGIKVSGVSTMVKNSKDYEIPMEILDDVSKALVKKKINSLREAAIKNRSLWKNYYRAMDHVSETYGNVDYGYAITSHKSQGSTYRNVYVMENDIMTTTGPSLQNKNQSMYVATSRASHKLTVISVANKKGAELENLTADIEGAIDMSSYDEGRNAPIDLGSEPYRGEDSGEDSDDDIWGMLDGTNVDHLPMGRNRGGNISDAQYRALLKHLSKEFLLQKKKYWSNGRQYQKAKIFGNVQGHKLAREIQAAYPWMGVHVNPIEGGKVRLALYDNRPNKPRIEDTSEDAPMSMSERISKAEGENKTSSQITLEYLQTRLNNINKAISDFRGQPKKEHALTVRKEIVEAEMESVINDETNSNLLRIADRELSIAREIYNQARLGDTDYEYIAASLNQIRGVAEFWQSINLFTSEEMSGSFLTPVGQPEGTPKIKTYSPNVQRMQAIITEANQLQKDSSEEMAKNMIKAMNSTSGINLSTLKESSDLKQFKDISWIKSRTMSLNRQDNELLQAMSVIMKQATARSNDEARIKFKELDTLSTNARKTAEFKAQGWDLFAQVNKDGDKTGDVVGRFSQDYFDERRKQANIAKKLNTPKGWERFNQWKRDNEIIFDVRKLFFEDGDGKFDEADKNAHIEELKEILGEKGFEKQYDIVNTRYLRYLGRKEAAYIDIETKGEDIGTTEGMKLLWEKKNSPFIYCDTVIDGSKNLMNDKFVKSEGYAFTATVPRTVNSKGKATGWYDEKFSTIENNDALMEFYNFFTDTTSELVDFLPRHLTQDVQVNTLPELRRTLIEKIYSQKNLKNGFQGIHDSIKEMISTREISDTSNYEINPATGQINPTSPVRMLQGKISPEEKSYDLDKVLKAFATMAISYKHTSRVENLLRNAQTIVNDADEIFETSDNRLIKQKGGSVQRVKGGLSRTKDLLNYGIESFYGMRKPESGVSSQKFYTTEEHKIKKKATEEMAAVTERHNNEEITTEEYEAIIEEIEEKYNLKDLGMNLTGSKVAKQFMKYVQLKGMGWNVVSATTNLIFGVLSNMNHASGRRDFSLNQMRRAFSVMLHTSAAALSGGLATSKTAKKVRSLMMKYDVLKEFNEEAATSTKNANDKKKGLRKLNPYNMQSSSEYFGQGQVMVAYMMATGLDGKKLTRQEIKDGKTSLWEAYDENGNFTKENAGNVEWEGNIDNLEHNKAKYDFQLKLDQILESIHGNYNPTSPILAKKTVWGAMLFQYRSWMPEGIASRMEIENTDTILGRKRKGRYRTYGSLGFKDSVSVMLKQIAMQGDKAFEGDFYSDGRGGKKGPMSEIDKENMRRNLFGLASLAALYGLGLALKALSGDDDDEEITNYFLNQIYRLETDLTFYTSPESFEALLQNPIPAFGTISDGFNLMGSVKDYLMGEDIIKNGPYAGESRLGRNIIKVTPFENLTLKLKMHLGEELSEK